MKHVLFGGDGFVGRYIARELLSRGEEVLICDRAKSDLPIYRYASHMEVDVRDAEAVGRVPINADDVVYNMAARLLMPPIKKKDRHSAFFPVHVNGGSSPDGPILDRYGVWAQPDTSADPHGPSAQPD